jgi:CubicO group peptidase (beta-lactamase class C family)
MTDWGRSVRHIEQARPTWPPGQVPAYHYISYGFILGELVRRVSGTSVPEPDGGRHARVTAPTWAPPS